MQDGTRRCVTGVPSQGMGEGIEKSRGVQTRDFLFLQDLLRISRLFWNFTSMYCHIQMGVSENGGTPNHTI